MRFNYVINIVIRGLSMLFNSYEFIILYLPIVLTSYYTLSKFLGFLAAKWFLVLASVFFYSVWDVSNLPILLISISVNFIFGNLLNHQKSKALLVVAVLFNLAFLGYFKYANFIIDNINLALNSGICSYSIELPLGISFFTFTQTAYLVDVYRGETKEYSVSDYLLFVTIFPHLIAGPILYHKAVIPQFSEVSRYRLNYKNMVYGIAWFVLGLAKKVLIADKLAIYASQVFNYVDSITTIDAWGGTLAYTLQLYFDFSGYSEMAIGLGLMLNFDLPQNFNSPYRACSIIEFWRRWHMTLSAFLKNYLYIPLGGNRNGHHMRNILITMFLGGLWHGAGWTFIFWGTLHGVFICINHLWRKTHYGLHRIVAWLLTFNAVNLAWVFFRAESFEQALKIIKAMLDCSSFAIPYSGVLGRFCSAFLAHETLLTINNLAIIICFTILSLIEIKVHVIEKFNETVLAVALSIVFLYCFTKLGTISEFLYFQF